MTENLVENLSKPFNLLNLKWKPQMVKTKKGDPYKRNSTSGEVQVVGCIVYVDAREVEDRLDAVVGWDNWNDYYETITIKDDGKEYQGLLCSLTIKNVTKQGIGTASFSDQLKGAESDALKRAAVKFGIGRYLYDFDMAWIPYDGWKYVNLSNEDYSKILHLINALHGELTDEIEDKWAKWAGAKKPYGRDGKHYFIELTPVEADKLIRQLESKVKE